MDIQYGFPTISDTSDEQPLIIKRSTTAQKRKAISLTKFLPIKLSIIFGDKTSAIVKSKNQVSLKAIMRRANKPRGTLKPIWNIITDGTITIYLPNTITIDTPTRKDTVIRKNDIVVAGETKPQLNENIACKTLGEYKRNRAKTRKFYLDEQDEIEKLALQHIAPT